MRNDHINNLSILEYIKGCTLSLDEDREEGFDSFYNAATMLHNGITNFYPLVQNIQEQYVETYEDAETLQSELDLPEGGEDSGWHLDAINVRPVWEDYTGEGVIVAVTESGFSNLYHTDLDDNICYDLISSTIYNWRVESSDSHGVMTMGLIGAEANGQDAVGVAYNAGLIPEVWDYHNIPNAVPYADVISNSWTMGYDYSAFEYDTNEVYLKEAVELGRNGLGSVVVFSGGNNRIGDVSPNSAGPKAAPETIAVAATNQSGHYWEHSSEGSSLLISAPGAEVMSTYTEGTASASGTSNSAPIVAGVVALMLEANPDLGWRDVQNILAYSAQHNDSSLSSWMYNEADTWNGGGLHFSNDYGFGLVDARAAVRLAETWTKQSTSVNQETISISTEIETEIPDNDGTSIIQSVDMTSETEVIIESVQVRVGITKDLFTGASHQLGELTLIIKSSSGTEAVLMETPMNGYTGAYKDIADGYTFSANNFRGESSHETWTLEVIDSSTGNVQTLTDWTLKINGRAATNDDTYIYSDDYAGFVDVSREILSDLDGGVDEINASMVTTDLSLDLRDGMVSTIAGKNLFIEAGTIIENAFGGDGNDTITGNYADNLLWGGRGNDTLDGGVGYDTVWFGKCITDYSCSFGTSNDVTISLLEDDIVTEVDCVLDAEAFLFDNYSITFSTLYDIVVNGIDHAAVAFDDLIDGENAVGDNVLHIFHVSELLANDLDLNDDTFEIVSVGNATNGATVTFDQLSDEITFTAAQDYTGMSTFDYTISDGTSTSTATVHVESWNKPPTAQDDVFYTDEDTLIRIDAADILANDFDINGDTLEELNYCNFGFSSVSGSHIYFDSQTDQVVYEPGANFFGEQSFSYYINDEHGIFQDTGTITIHVNPIHDDPPVAENDAIRFGSEPSTEVPGHHLFYASELLGNDTDPDIIQPTITSIGTAQYGVINDVSDILTLGSYGYVPGPDFTGYDYFVYTIADENGAQDTAFATIIIIEDNYDLSAIDMIIQEMLALEIDDQEIADQLFTEYLDIFSEHMSSSEMYAYLTDLLAQDKLVEFSAIIDHLPSIYSGYSGIQTVDLETMLQTLTNIHLDNRDIRFAVGSFVRVFSGNMSSTVIFDTLENAAVNGYPEIVGAIADSLSDDALASINPTTWSQLIDNIADAGINNPEVTVDAAAASIREIMENLSDHPYGMEWIIDMQGLSDTLKNTALNGHLEIVEAIVDNLSNTDTMMISPFVWGEITQNLCTVAASNPEAVPLILEIMEQHMEIADVVSENLSDDVQVLISSQGWSLLIDKIADAGMYNLEVTVEEAGALIREIMENLSDHPYFDVAQLVDMQGLSCTLENAAVNGHLEVVDAITDNLSDQAQAYVGSQTFGSVIEGIYFAGQFDPQVTPEEAASQIREIMEDLGDHPDFDIADLVDQTSLEQVVVDAASHKDFETADAVLDNLDAQALEALDTDVLQQFGVSVETQNSDSVYDTAGESEAIYGLAGDDVVIGGEGNTALFGGDGNDYVYDVGSVGEDIISGGDGSDYLYGGADADTFVFHEGETGVDTIYNFSVEEGDKLDISDYLEQYDELQHAIDDFVILTESDSGTTVSVDVDGQGGQPAQEVAFFCDTLGLEIEDVIDMTDLG